MSTSSLVPTTVGSLDLDRLERTFGVFLIGYVVQMIGYGFTFFRAFPALWFRGSSLTCLQKPTYTTLVSRTIIGLSD